MLLSTRLIDNIAQLKKLLPIGKAILNTKEIDFENLELVGDGAEYALYADDGVCREYGVDRLRVLRR